MFRCIVLVPSYNSGLLLRSTVSAVLAVWPDVVVVTDGSTDGSDRTLDDMLPAHAGLKILHLAQNGGKGHAVLQGALWALQAGYTHALTMDADGQHPAQAVADFIALSRSAPQALVLGVPVFGARSTRSARVGAQVIQYPHWYGNRGALLKIACLVLGFIHSNHWSRFFRHHALCAALILIRRLPRVWFGRECPHSINPPLCSISTQPKEGFPISIMCGTTHGSFLCI
jgi:glycosyltransferase involved in cell wall biosynthesis